MEASDVFVVAMSEDEMIISIEEYDDMVTELEELRAERGMRACG